MITVSVGMVLLMVVVGQWWCDGWFCCYCCLVFYLFVLLFCVSMSCMCIVLYCTYNTSMYCIYKYMPRHFYLSLCWLAVNNKNRMMWCYCCCFCCYGLVTLSFHSRSLSLSWYIIYADIQKIWFRFIAYSIYNT